MTTETTQRQPEGRRVTWAIIACLVAATATFFLWDEHESHFLRAVPYTLLLLCPAIHLLMHRNHGSRHDHQPGR